MNLISLASGGSYFRSPAPATDAAISALQEGKTFYGPTEGIPELRQAICNLYIKAGLQVRPEQVLITPGSKQALFNLFTNLLCQGDEVVVPTPAWFGFRELMKYSKGQLVPLETKLSEGYALTPEALRKTLNERSRILLLTNPGNPTGRLYTKVELEALLEVTHDFPNLYILSDEIYDRVTYGGAFTSLLSCQGAKAERSVLINGFSKSFAMSGWRLGYILGPEEVIQKCVDFQASTLAGVSVFLQEAAQAALVQAEQVLPEMLEVLTQNRQIMQQGLDAIPEVKCYLPDGAYYFFPDFSYYLHRRTPAGDTLPTSVDLCRYLRESHGIELAPGDYFGAPGHARMSFAIETPKLREAMQRLKQALGLLIVDC
ncbi:aminotransferase class I/II-fold pyridoxal phosphate-dependent enzyme [Pontibacter russatus]|uniref:aminotransferase class I/II-fold pyridoxal phosphate-dependent enzyme n=1 Tax=Pontibacter russatus TaxID=2694929 RepID=UPI00137AC1AD|nr:aminotransferase class I/II-fold pyridoxal phosphate-dependent enzyme [Pontibacter russatus]